MTIDHTNGIITLHVYSEDITLRGKTYDLQLKYDPQELDQIFDQPAFLDFSLTYSAHPCYDTSFVEEGYDFPQIKVNTLYGTKQEFILSEIPDKAALEKGASGS